METQIIKLVEGLLINGDVQLNSEEEITKMSKEEVKNMLLNRIETAHSDYNPW